MRIQYEEEDKAEVAMSPLIDCVFLLLIFFLVTTMMKKQDRDFDFDLPVSKSALDFPPDDQQLVIGIDAEGTLHLDGEETSLDLLYTKLRDLGESDPSTHIRLDCDQESPFERVVEVLDQCQFRNLHNVGVRTYDEHYNR
jgi:biopolymer transport protein ExbD